LDTVDVVANIHAYGNSAGDRDHRSAVGFTFARR